VTTNFKAHFLAGIDGGVYDSSPHAARRIYCAQNTYILYAMENKEGRRGWKDKQFEPPLIR
jgi:hypothetical protein